MINEPVVFNEVEFIYKNHKVVWEYIGEGWSGEYDSEDPGDTPLLRFSCYRFDYNTEGGWKELEDASYCTRMPVTAPLRALALAAAVIMEAILDGAYKRRLEELSWFCPEDFDSSGKVKNPEFSPCTHPDHTAHESCIDRAVACSPHCKCCLGPAAVPVYKNNAELGVGKDVRSDDLGLFHEIWAAAQLLPGEGIEDGVSRIVDILKLKKE